MTKIQWPLIILLSLSCSVLKKKESKVVSENQPPKIVFTLTDGISHPESALYSAEHNVIFVSNIATGNPVETKRLAYISKVSIDGELVKSKWITGLRAPKGMAIVGNFLYVSDVNQAVKIDIKKAKIVQKISLPKAKFLNDVVADSNGNIYISDMFENTIYIWNKKGLKPWFKSPTLRGPNGMYTDGKEHLLLASWGNPIDMKTFETKSPGALSTISLTDPKKVVNEESSVRGNLDGIAFDNQKRLWISDWMNGDVYVVKMNGSAQKRFNFGKGTADISVAKELNLLLIPQMNESKLIGVNIE